MATSSCTDYNLESSDNNIPQKKKYTRTRSKAYRKRRSARRKKQTIYKSKRLQRFLIHKTKKLQMSSSSKQMLGLPSSVVHENSKRWQSSDEIAFWKSRAVSLQYENKMLYNHIEEMYTNMINLKSNTPKVVEAITEDTYYENDDEYLEANAFDENNDCDDEDNDFNKESKQFRIQRDKERNAKLLKSNNYEDDLSSKPPTKQTNKKREEEMKKLYGSAWRKIMGMETGVQLHYDLILDKHKINYWPVLPINL